MSDPIEFLQQENLYTDFLQPFGSLIKAVSEEGSYLEKQILIWCIINYIPLAQFREEDLCITFYEDWILDPEKEYSRISNLLGETEEGALKLKDSYHYKKPSKTSAQKEFSIIDWRDKLSREELSSGLRILVRFGLSELYDSDSKPDHIALAQYRARLRTTK